MRFTPSQIGVQLYTLRDHFRTREDVMHTLKAVRDIGYEAVQFFEMPIAVEEMRDILKGLGLRVCGVDVNVKRLQSELGRVLEEMKLLECPYITYSYGGDWRRPYAHGLEGYIADISAVGEQLKETDCRFVYHNHSFEFISYKGRNALEYFYEQTEQAGILAEIDTFWVQHGGGDPAAWIRKYKGRVPIIHLKDLAIEQSEGKVNQLFAEVGNGNMNWEAILSAADESDVEWLVVEQDTCKQDPFLSVKESYNHIKAVITR